MSDQVDAAAANGPTAATLVACTTADGEVITVEARLLRQARIFDQMCRDLDEEITEFEVKEISTPIFEKVVEWLKHHDGKEEPVIKEDPATRERIWFTLDDFEKNFFDVPVDVLCDLLTAGNFLDLKSLYLFGCQSMAALIKDKSPEEVRELLGIENDLTPEEIEEIRKANVWCNY